MVRFRHGCDAPHSTAYGRTSFLVSGAAIGGRMGGGLILGRITATMKPRCVFQPLSLFFYMVSKMF